MRTFLSKIESVLTYALLLLRAVLVKHRPGDSDSILIAQGGNIGDALMNGAAIVKIAEHYTAKGKEVYFVCPEVSWSVLRCVPGTETLKYIGGVGGSEKKISCRSIYQLFSRIGKRRFEKTIAFMCRELKWPYIAINFSPDTIMANMYTNSLLKRTLNNGLSLLATIIPDDPNMSRFNLMEKLLYALGIDDYNASIAFVPKHNSTIKIENAYITVSVDSSTPSRRWPIGNFIELVNRLLSWSERDVVLTGKNLSNEESKQYDLAFESNKRVLNYIGKTNIAEWIELIRESDFLIGVDSGAIHVAASVGTQAFCLTGVWDGHRFFPYKVKKHDIRTKAPICITKSDLEKMNCFDCLSLGKMGNGNKECKTRCKHGQPCLCLVEITVDDVMAAIEEAKCDGVF